MMLPDVSWWVRDSEVSMSVEGMMQAYLIGFDTDEDSEDDLVF